MPRRYPHQWIAPHTNYVQASCHQILIPDEQLARTAFWGALQLLAEPQNWEPHWGIPSDMIARQFAAWIEQSRLLSQRVPCMLIGMMFLWPTDNIPEGCLPCDGRSLDKILYPQLYQVIGDTYGGTAGTYNLPDFRGRFPLGAGQGDGLTNRPLAGTGGEERVSLSTNELPSHHHDVPATYVTLSDIPVGAVPVLSPAPPLVTQDTSNTGENDGHYNMPPYLSINVCIVVL